MSIKPDFVMFHRTDGTAVSCCAEKIIFGGRGEWGAILNFSGGTQINVHENFDEVMDILTAESL